MVRHFLAPPAEWQHCFSGADLSMHHLSDVNFSHKCLMSQQHVFVMFGLYIQVRKVKFGSFVTWEAIFSKTVLGIISVARDLPPTGSEANTTICFYIYIGYRFSLSLSTIWGNHLPFNFMLKFPISTIWRNHLPFNQ